MNLMDKFREYLFPNDITNKEEKNVSKPLNMQTEKIDGSMVDSDYEPKKSMPRIDANKNKNNVVKFPNSKTNATEPGGDKR